MEKKKNVLENECGAAVRDDGASKTYASVYYNIHIRSHMYYNNISGESTL